MTIPLKLKLMRIFSSAFIVSNIIQFQLCDAFLTARPSLYNNSIRHKTLVTHRGRLNEPMFSLRAAPDASIIAQGLGYVVAAGSLSLYTPIAFRVQRQKSADGLTLSTWWIKMASYSCSGVYAYTHAYPLSAWAETLVINIEATAVLFLVAYYQNKMDVKFFGAGVIFCISVVLLANSPPEVIAFGQASSSILNVIAVFPQFALNARLKTSGDYSPITAGLASAGCAVRLFTTVQLAGSDPLLLGSYGLALTVNFSLLSQIIWYGVTSEGRSLMSVLKSDLGRSDEGIEEIQLGTTDFIQLSAEDNIARGDSNGLDEDIKEGSFLDLQGSTVQSTMDVSLLGESDKRILDTAEDGTRNREEGN